MELVILSGKGGTGKTSMVGSLAALAENKVMVDCDVDAADLHLLLGTKTGPARDFICGSKAVIDMDKCMVCGMCTPYCRFNAIKNEPDENSKFGEIFRVDPYACEGCGVCTHFCPEAAIELEETNSGQWFISETNYGTLVHARLGIAEANSGKMVSLLRSEADKIAKKKNAKLIITDGPPGIGCPVIAALTGADYVLIVTEPSTSAFHDMERLLQLTGHFAIPTGVVINKCDINPDVSAEIEKFVSKTGAEVLGRIEYDAQFTKSQLEGVPLIEYTDDGVAGQVREIWEKLQVKLRSLGETKTKSSEKLII